MLPLTVLLLCLCEMARGQGFGYPGARLHYVDIGPQLAGDYKFGYDTGKGPLGQSFREEVRLADGTVKGAYGMVDDRGQTRIVRYSAGKSGFVAEEQKDSLGLSDPLVTRAIKPPKAPRLEKLRLPQSFKLFDSAEANSFKPLQDMSSSLNSFKSLQDMSSSLELPVSSYKLPETREVVKEVRQRNPRRRPKKVMPSRGGYDPKMEDEYYDSAPAFIDIERLSYNIGVDKSVSS